MARSCEFTICLRPRPSASAFSAPWRASSACRQYQCESRTEPAPPVETRTARYSSAVNHRGRSMREPRPPSVPDSPLRPCTPRLDTLPRPPHPAPSENLGITLQNPPPHLTVTDL